MAATSTPPDQVIPAPAGLELPYPAQTRQAAGLIDGVQTDVLLVSFADKVVVTITQNGRLAQWVRLSTSLAGFADDTRTDNISAT